MRIIILTTYVPCKIKFQHENRYTNLTRLLHSFKHPFRSVYIPTLYAGRTLNMQMLAWKREKKS